MQIEKAGSVDLAKAYVVEGDKWITKVDVSWNEVLNAQDQIRFFKLEGERLTVRTLNNRAVSSLAGKP